jgi:hypothetical protein
MSNVNEHCIFITLIMLDFYSFIAEVSLWQKQFIKLVSILFRRSQRRQGMLQ